MRNIKLVTQNGLTNDIQIDPVVPWGGFDYIMEKAAELLAGDPTSEWVVAEEGQGANRYEQTIFRGWFESRGMLNAPGQ